MKDIQGLVDRLIKKANTSNVYEICDHFNIQFLFVPLGTIKAFTTTNYRIKTIFLNEELDERERIFSIAHELGHIFLQHDYNKIWLSNHTGHTLNKFENEANKFAVRLLISPYIDEIEELEYKTAGNISMITGISQEYINLI